MSQEPKPSARRSAAPAATSTDLAAPTPSVDAKPVLTRSRLSDQRREHLIGLCEDWYALGYERRHIKEKLIEAQPDISPNGLLAVPREAFKRWKVGPLDMTPEAREQHRADQYARLMAVRLVALQGNRLAIVVSIEQLIAKLLGTLQPTQTEVTTHIGSEQYTDRSTTELVYYAQHGRWPDTSPTEH